MAVPEPLVKQWFHHASHGGEFRRVMDSIVEKFGQAEVSESLEKKRALFGGQPVPKRLKVDFTTVDLDKLTGTEVAQA